MAPVSFTYSGTVPAPMDKVFALISDPMRMPEWLPRCVAVKATTQDKTPGKGARYKLTFQREVQQHESVIEIIDYSPPHTFGWVEIYHRAGSKTFFALRFDGGSTKVTFKLSAKARKALKSKKSVKARLTVVATDAAGNRATKELSVTLRR